MEYGGATPLVAPATGGVIVLLVEEHRSALALIDVDGRTVWEHRVKHWPSSPTCPPTVDHGRLYYGSYDDLLVLDVVSGKEVQRGRLPMGGYVGAAPLPVDNLLLLPTGRLLALDRSSLGVVWGSDRASAVDAQPVVGDGAVYLAAYRELMCLELGSGKTVWRSDCGENDPQFFHRPTLLGDRMFVPVGRHWRALLCVRRADGRAEWRNDLDQDRPAFNVTYGFDSSCTLVGDSVLVGSPNGRLYALEQSNGSVLWRFCTGGAILARPLLVGDVVLCGSTDGHLYAVNPADGQMLWKIDVGGEVWDPPVFQDNLMFVTALRLSGHAGEGRLCAMEL